MDDLYNISILDNIDNQFSYGDKVVDPFTILDVRSIKIDSEFIEVFEIIDLENLYNETSDFDINNYQHLICQLMTDEDDREILLRFSWWICRELIFSPEGKHYINIIDICKDQEKDTYLKIFIYHLNGFYRIGINVPDGPGIIIKFTNNKVLI